MLPSGWMRRCGLSSLSFRVFTPYPEAWIWVSASSKWEADRITGFVVCPDWNSTSERAERSVGSTIPTTSLFPSNPMGSNRRDRTVSSWMRRWIEGGTSTRVRLICCSPVCSDRAFSSTSSVR